MDNVQKATFLRRLGAALIDGILLAVATGLLFSILGISNNSESPSSPANMIQIAISLTYYVAFTMYKAQTPGKMALNIKVVSEAGTALTLQQVVMREVVGKLLSSIALGLGYLWMLWDPKKQTWHDKIAKTFVVKA